MGSSGRSVAANQTKLLFLTEEIPKLDVELPLLHALEEKGVIDTRTSLRVKLAFQEAIANSVEHGNLELQSSWKEDFDESGRDRFTWEKNLRLQDPHYGKRKVEVVTSFTDSILEIQVCDEGPGFDPHSIGMHGGRRIDDSLLSGRGLRLIYEVADLVQFEDGGRRIILKVNLGTTGDGSPLQGEERKSR